MQERNEEWWECANGDCGHRIQFLVLGNAATRMRPTCFCGGVMNKTYTLPRWEERQDILATVAVTRALASASDQDIELFFFEFRAANCLPGHDVR